MQGSKRAGLVMNMGGARVNERRIGGNLEHGGSDSGAGRLLRASAHVHGKERHE